MSLRPPVKKQHVLLILVFLVLGVMGIGITGYQQYKNDEKNDKLIGQITSFVNASKTQATIDDVRKIGTDMQDEMQTGLDRVIAAIKGKPEPPQKAATITQAPVPTVENTRLIQKTTTSDNSELPYGLQVIIQSNIVMQPVSIALECNGEIGDFSFFIAGQVVYMNVRKSINGNVAQLSFGSPPLTPESPLVITLLSKKQISVIKAYKLKF